jgi:hypothetical protein
MPDKPMTAKQFVRALERLGYTKASKHAAEALGLSTRQLIRLSNGQSPVSPTIQKLLECLLAVQKRKR